MNNLQYQNWLWTRAICERHHDWALLPILKFAMTIDPTNKDTNK
jgi:hypothetical protein